MGAATFLIASVAATGAAAGPASGGASVTILSPVIAREQAPLAFGSIAAGGSAVVLTVNPNGTTRCSVIGACKGGAAPAIFTLEGAAGERVDVSVTDHATLTSVAGDSMQVSLLLASPQADLAAGAARVSVGGELVVPAGQAPGQYHGTYQINVNYQ